MGSEKPCVAEMDNRTRMRRGMYAARDLEKGHHLQPEDIQWLRPETRHLPMGARLRKDYAKGEAL